MKAGVELLLSPRMLKAGASASAGKGRGVFATADIEAGELIDVCACVELDQQACARITGTPIDDYYFRHPADPECGLLVLGLASLCNHSDDPNTQTRYEHERSLGWLIVLAAARRIACGEELTRRYACPPWFPINA